MKIVKVLVSAIVVVGLALGVTAYVNTKHAPIVVSSVGQKGDTGEQGPQGLRGPVGPQGPAGKDASPILGASAGPDHYNLENFYGNLTMGSGEKTISDSASTGYTLTAQDLLNYHLFTVSTTTSTSTYALTLPTTLGTLLPAVGQSMSWIVRNTTGSTTSAVTITASTTVVDLQIPETTGADTALNNNNYAFLRCFRISATARLGFNCTWTETIPGD